VREGNGQLHPLAFLEEEIQEGNPDQRGNVSSLLKRARNEGKKGEKGKTPLRLINWEEDLGKRGTD